MFRQALSLRHRRRAGLPPVGSLLLILALSGVPFAAAEEAPPVTDAPIVEPVPEQSPLERALQAELERAARAGERLDELDAALEASLERQETETRAALERIATLTQELRATDERSAAADRVYDSSVEQLITAREALRSALAASQSATSVSSFETTVDVRSLEATNLQEPAAELERVVAQLAERRRDLVAKEDATRWAVVDGRAEIVRRLNDLRIRSLEELSSSRRSAVLGLSREGLGQLNRELEHLSLTTRLYTAHHLRDVRSVPQQLRDVFVVGTVTWTLLKLLVIVAVYVFLRRRGERVREATRNALFGLSGAKIWRRRFETWVDLAAVVAPWAVYLLMLRALLWAAGNAAAWPEVQVVYRVAVLYGFYRLLIDAIVATIVRSVRRYLKITPARTARLLRSVRTILRVVIAIVVLLVLSSRLLGQGYLYHLVELFAVLAVLLALVSVLRSWQESIADTYLESGPAGRLKEWVRHSRDRWYGVFVAAASLVWLSGRAGVFLAGEFALRFDQTRKALSFLFRRRIEKQAERTGYAETDVGELPERLVAAFSEGPLPESSLLIDRFPGMDRLTQAVQAWRDGAGGGSFVLTGEIGVGRSCWLGRIETGDLPCTRISLERRVTSDQELAGVIGEAIELDKPDGMQQVRTTLLASPPQMVILDHAQSLFLGRVGGYEAFESFVSLVDATSDHVFWLVSFNRAAYEHIEAVHPDLVGFRHHVRLAPWSEEEIRNLLRARNAYSGVRLTYEDLVVESVEAFGKQERLAETEQGYTRLLWDYSGGIPRVALHFWLRSLVPQEDGHVRVRLFRAPPIEMLEELGDAALFILAAIVVHENLTLREAALVLRYSERMCRIHLRRLTQLGVVRRDGIRYRLTPYWQRAVFRLLKRKNLLSD